MNFSNIFSRKDKEQKKQALREAFGQLKTNTFPDGIYGQIGIDYSAKGYKVDFPFSVNGLEQEILDGLEHVLAEPVSATFNYLPTNAISQKVNNIKMVVAVASGKGGVGKSTVTANLAVTLASTGHKVGVLDADIYGPSMPLMFGLQGKSINSPDGKVMLPMESHGVHLNSIGLLVPEDKATIWRGPMASKALLQVLNETKWPELDILLVDMPPGTGDIQLTMSETVKCDGAVIVTTPQTVALADADKGINMFNKVDTPILGLIENMSQFVCDGCGKAHKIFGDSGGVECAARHNIPVLGQLPLIPEVRECGDSGTPFALNENNEYRKIAFSLMMQLSKNTNSVIVLS